MTLTSRPPDGVRPDGRRLRTEESRRRVVAALLECVREGDFDPSAEAVAQRAGVGLRTVFRLFKDKDGLVRQMSEAVLSRISDLANAPLAGRTWREQLDDLMTRRFTAYEQVMPYRRAAMAHAHHSEVVRSNNETLRQHMRKMLSASLPADLRADHTRLDALEMILSIEAWIRLRIEQKLDPARARAAIRRAVFALLPAEA
ncbi:MAG TPA: TetR/AcrR family transcriptional regulator [Caulobacteraceae bacterium]|nr:TetR/AcrR family transcriptional regulator [Caulobacteraceae bacterium]